MELAFRILLTIVFTAAWLIALNWVWTNQLDPRATVRRALGRVVAPPEWVAIREPNRIYQNGNAVGEVTGAVEEREGRVRFARLANTAGFDSSRPFEYRRFTLRIVRVGEIAGMKVEMTENGPRTLTE